ncbi:MAG: hypothetical protein ACLFVO_21185 [Chloroflexaceae bacterium]
MSTQLHEVITAARELSPRDKLALREILARDLQQTYAFTGEQAAFWSSRSLDAIAEAQAAPVITDIRTLGVDFWPEDASADDVNQFVAAQRHADRVRDA